MSVICVAKMFPSVLFVLSFLGGFAYTGIFHFMLLYLHFGLFSSGFIACLASSLLKDDICTKN